MMGRILHSNNSVQLKRVMRIRPEKRIKGMERIIDNYKHHEKSDKCCSLIYGWWILNGKLSHSHQNSSALT